MSLKVALYFEKFLTFLLVMLREVSLGWPAALMCLDWGVSWMQDSQY